MDNDMEIVHTHGNTVANCSFISESSTTYVSDISFYKESITGNDSLLTSTPNVDDTCEGHDDIDGTKRVRRKECNRLHYTNDLDDSSLTYYEGGKSRKRRATLLESFSFEDDEREEFQLDTLENHLFPDMTFTKSHLAYDNAKFRSLSYGDISWSKMQGVSYSSKYDFSDEDLGDLVYNNNSINHPKRSIFRQNRRLWYLNRRNQCGKDSKYTESSWKKYISRYFHIIFFQIIIMIHKISRKVDRKLYFLQKQFSSYFNLTDRYLHEDRSTIYHFLLLIYTSLKRRIILVYSRLTGKYNYSEAYHDKKSGFFQFCCRAIWFLIWILILSSIFVGIYLVQKQHIPLHDPSASKISNAYPFYIDSQHSKIPVWHIHPPSQIYPSRFPNNSPVIFYIRKKGKVDTPELIKIYETLSSLGYHIIVPTSILTKSEIMSAWHWIKGNCSSSILWGYEFGASTLTGYAKLFCKDLIPPSGVIISKVVESGNLPRIMEVWSCSCALAQDGISNETDYKYNHVKCPIGFSNQSDDGIYAQIVSCIETVGKNIN